MKKRHLLFGTTALLLSHIGMEINQAKKHYNWKKQQFVSEHFTFHMMNQQMHIQQKKQRLYQFAVSRKENGQDVAIVCTRMGHERESYYGGHIDYQEAVHLTCDERKEIYERLFELYREKLMGHIYFVCTAKDRDEIRFVENLGAIYTKDVIQEQTIQGKNKRTRGKKQYKLVLIEDKKKK